MYTSEVDLWNLALTVLGISTRIQATTERSKEAATFRDIYEGLRDTALRDFDWPFARRYLTLQQVAQQPNAEWQFSYRVPPNVLAVRYLVNPAGRNLTPGIPFDLVSDDTGMLVLTDQDAAVAVVTTGITDVSKFPPDFGSTLALLLAGMGGTRIAGGDIAGLATRALQLYANRIGVTRANAFNEAQHDPPPDSDFITARL